MFNAYWKPFLVPVSEIYWRALHIKRRDAYIQCYKILGVDENDDQDTVRRAYISLVKKVHPDSGKPEASSERFQEVDEAFKLLQEKFAKGRRNIAEDEEEPIEFDIRHTAPQHRQYLNYGGVGIGTPYQREKQYQKVKAMQAQEAVLKHRIDKAIAGENTLMKKSNHYQKHAIKTKYGIERIVEDLIQESMSKGDFQNLKGIGKPLSSAQTQNPYLDFTTHKLNKILLDNGFTPEWITLNREIRIGMQELKDTLRSERKYYGDYPLQPPQDQEWRAYLRQCREKVHDLNKLIDKYNLIVPILENQFFRVRLETMAEHVLKEEHLPRNVKRTHMNAETGSEGHNKSLDTNSNLFTLLTNLFRV